MTIQTAVRCVAVALSFGLSATAQAEISRAHLNERVAASHRSIESMQVAYSYPAAGPGGHYKFTELSFLGSRLIVVDSGHGWDHASWKAFYPRTRSYVRGDHYEVEWPSKLACESRRLEPREQIQRVAVEAWLRASGYWPENACLPEPAFFEVSTRLMTAVNDETYRLEAQSELACGVTCVVLTKPNADRIWLDPERGFAIRKRQWFLDGKLGMEVEVSRLERMNPSVFMPKTFRITTFLRSNGETIEIPLVMDCTVETNRLNDVEPTELVYAPGPGAFRFSRIDPSKDAQINPGGLEFLLREADKQQARFAARRSGLAIGWLFLSLLIVGFWIASWSLPRRLVRYRQWQRSRTLRLES